MRVRPLQIQEQSQMRPAKVGRYRVKVKLNDGPQTPESSGGHGMPCPYAGPEDARRRLRLLVDGDGYVHRSGRRRPRWFRRLIRLVIAIPEGFAGSLPEARADPNQYHELAEQKRSDVG